MSNKKIKCKDNFGNSVSIPRENFFFRPSVYGVIIKNNRVLLMKNKRNGKLWFPGGGVEVGEKILSALRREVMEEAGLKIKIKQLLLAKENFFYYKPESLAFHAFLFFYRCDILSNKKKFIRNDEPEIPKWINVKKLKKDDFSDLNEEVYLMLSEASIL